jgi:hypothetical protein
LVEGEWVFIPPNGIRHRADNPTGQAVVCCQNDELLPPSIFCFVPPPEV